MGISLVAGRNLTLADGAEGSPTRVVVNQSFARRFFPNQNPLGRQFGMGRDQIVKAAFEIVGVVTDARYRSFREPFQPTLFSCFCGARAGDSYLQLEVRSQAQPETVISSIQARMRSIDPRLPFREIRTLRQDVNDSLWGERSLASAASATSLLAAAIACVGLYGLLSFTLTQRRREIGIRIALGARPSDIGRATLLRVSLILLSGAALGILAAIPAARLMSSVLFEISPGGSPLQCRRRRPDAPRRTRRRRPPRLARHPCRSLAIPPRRMNATRIRIAVAALIGAVAGWLSATRHFPETLWDPAVLSHRQFLVASLAGWCLLSLYWEAAAKTAAPARSSETSASRALHVTVVYLAAVLVFLPLQTLGRFLPATPFVMSCGLATPGCRYLPCRLVAPPLGPELERRHPDQTPPRTRPLRTLPRPPPSHLHRPARRVRRPCHHHRRVARRRRCRPRSRRLLPQDPHRRSRAPGCLRRPIRPLSPRILGPHPRPLLSPRSIIPP